MIEPVKRLNVGDEIVNQIKDLFLAGKLKVGDRLPPEREMMDMFHVGRTSVREALKVLESLGLIERSQKGTFISTNFNVSYAESLVYQFYFSEAEWDDIFEARWIIEKELTFLVANRATKEELMEIEQTIDDMEMAIEEYNQENYVISNMMFHKKIAIAARNVVMLDMYNSISNLILRIQEVLGTHQEALLVQSVMQDSLEYHRKIMKALNNRDAEEASKLMKNHIQIVQGYFKKA
jgi:GntR family transcriptional repressor for pyruvate dehydrogenase complex